MGYSAATPIKSRKAQQKMLSFLREHLRPAHWNNPDDQCAWMRAMTDDLSYDQSKLKIGFDYFNSQNFYGEYLFAVLRWMALRVGRKVRLKDYTEPIPYYMIDGYMPVPVLLRSTWEGRQLGASHEGGFVDEDGFMPPRKPWLPVSDRMDGHVERAVTTNAPESVLAHLMNDDRVTVTDAPPYRIEASEPSMVSSVKDQIEALGYRCDVEFGPPVLNLGRQRMYELQAPQYERMSQMIKLELARLSKLWAEERFSSGSNS